MTSGDRNEPTWYHAAVGPDPTPYSRVAAADTDGRPNRGAMVAAAVFIVVIIGSIGVSVSALRSDGRRPSDGPSPATETAAPSSTTEPSTTGPSSTGGSTGTDDDADDAEREDERTAAESTPSTTVERTRPVTTEVPPTRTERPREHTTPSTHHEATTTTTAEEEAHGPTVLSVSAPETFVCSDAPEYEGMGWLTLSWSTAHADSVAISIDHVGGYYDSGLPTDGALEVPAPCSGETNTYYVTAVGIDGTTDTMSVTTTGI